MFSKKKILISILLSLFSCERLNRNLISVAFTKKGDYARMRASDYKHLPAVILNIFCEYTRVMFDIVMPTKIN